MSITLGTGVCKLMNILYEDLRAKKGVYQFLADFHFCRLELIFHRLACFDMKRTRRSAIVSAGLRFVLQK